MSQNDEISAIRREVAQGIRDAVSDPETWEVAFEAFNKYAQSRTGKMLLGGIGVVFRRLVFVGLILAGVYAIGGLPAIIALFKSQA